jgi:hypothetical protein
MTDRWQRRLLIKGNDEATGVNGLSESTATYDLWRHDYAGAYDPWTVGSRVRGVVFGIPNVANSAELIPSYNERHQICSNNRSPLRSPYDGLRKNVLHVVLCKERGMSPNPILYELQLLIAGRPDVSKSHVLMPGPVSIQTTDHKPGAISPSVLHA